MYFLEVNISVSILGLVISISMPVYDFSASVKDEAIVKDLVRFTG
jgi:hypothetical protein